ncbi:MAG TPA: glutathione S-transferase family protein, partial [Paraburkholderia sp.]
MKLIGMLDSPYVRRVAICLKLLKLDFEHESISVFSTYDQFAKINPVVKAPTLITGEGIAVMDSTVILQYLATLAGPAQRLFPSRPDDALRAARLTGLALAACEKTVQIVYERNLRPLEKQHEPWLERVRAQLLAAYGQLESDVA